MRRTSVGARLRLVPRVDELRGTKQWEAVAEQFEELRRVPERSNGAVLETGEPQGSVGSNPTPAAHKHPFKSAWWPLFRPRRMGEGMRC